jgi:hypothetical protein
MNYKIEFTNKKVTPWSGMVLMKIFLDKMNIIQQLEEIDLPKQNSNRGYTPSQLIINFWVSIWCGASKFEHLEVTRHDEIIQKIFGWKKMPGNKSFTRYFKKFSYAPTRTIFTEYSQWFFNNIKFDNYTLDVDSSVFTRYGNQEGAEVGYNPKKPGRKSHHPLIAFLPECKMISNFWLRSGKSYTSNNIYSFIEDTFERLKGKKIGLFRGDSGFCDNAVMEYLETPREVSHGSSHETPQGVPTNYIISGKFYRPIKREILSRKEWWKISEGIETSEIYYKSPEWEKTRRIVIIRQSIKERPNATGKGLKLFSQEDVYGKYRYSCMVTNLDLPSAQIWKLYKGRAESENRIKEIKYDFGADSFNMKEFYGTDAALNFVIMAYNIMSLFRQTVIQGERFNRLSTLRYTTFGIGGYITKRGSQKILKLSLDMKRRKWFKGLWAKTHVVFAPYVLA